MTGEQGVRAVEITKPLDDFKKAAQTSCASATFVYLAHGATYTFQPR